ncbi:hypothetical protein EV702DRAFT_386529 [Suillus placidus]|uniref:Uncharacterized protein n=1 Tax=Suillus placidus TaxID=48579 RepID=A0A9P7D835_9AGAM|nr:hypothetical protein EV702DRAFT_386529 [Suillus placidus]
MGTTQEDRVDEAKAFELYGHKPGISIPTMAGGGRIGGIASDGHGRCERCARFKLRQASPSLPRLALGPYLSQALARTLAQTLSHTGQIPDFLRRTVFTSALEGAWTGVGHREMVWCHQMVRIFCGYTTRVTVVVYARLVTSLVARAALELGGANSNVDMTGHLA